MKRTPIDLKEENLILRKSVAKGKSKLHLVFKGGAVEDMIIDYPMDEFLSIWNDTKRVDPITLIVDDCSSIVTFTKKRLYLMKISKND